MTEYLTYALLAVALAALVAAVISAVKLSTLSKRSREERYLLRSLRDSARDESGRSEERFRTFAMENKAEMAEIRESTERQLDRLRGDNNRKLDEMRLIVEEKLQKTLNERMTESFRLVNDRLEQVYKGLGEMRSLAQGVGDLKRVLSNVKTRGTLGEVQLRSILSDVLAPGQYEENVEAREGSGLRVEFAVKLPADDGSFMYLPIDSKFPGDTYAKLREAYDSNEPAKVELAARALVTRVKAEARDIREKYISPPRTTEFGILFLPFEGLYAEVVNRGLIEELQREFRVNVAGPSTMAAILNSLQMSFRTYAIQRRSGEVWDVLTGVAEEFDKFGAALAQAQGHIRQADDDIERLVGARTRMIKKRLSRVETLREADAGKGEEDG